MKFVTFRVYASGYRVAVNPEAVSLVGEMPDRIPQIGDKDVTYHAVIHRIDGGSVEVTSTYEQAMKALEEQ